MAAVATVTAPKRSHSGRAQPYTGATVDLWTRGCETVSEWPKCKSTVRQGPARNV